VKRRALLWALALGAAALVAAGVGRRAPVAAAGRPAVARADAAKLEKLMAAAPVLSRSAAAAAPPPSLAGTDVDGGLDADTAGDLVVNEELRRFFDYFLAATGEEPPEIIRARIEAALDARLPPRAARQGKALLARYLAYRDGARGLRTDGELEARLAAVRALRRDHLGPDAAAKLFASSDAADDAALARRRVLSETEPGSAERARGLADVEARLPETLRAAEAEATAPLAAMRGEEGLRAAGAGDAEVRSLREAAFGEGGAARLAALDRERAAFRARLEAFRAQRTNLSEDAARRLMEQTFAPSERIRVEALDRLAGR
jgi:lipase chaperone LimK